MRKTATPWGKIALVSATVLAAAAFAQAGDNDKDRDSGDDVVRTYDLTGFDGIDISGVYDVEVSVGQTYSIRLEGREKDLDRVKVEVDGDTLELGKNKSAKKYSKMKSIDAYITLPRLNSLDVSGVTDVEIVGIDSSEFNLDVSGVADVVLEGQCGSIDADISGVSDVDASELECESAPS